MKTYNIKEDLVLLIDKRAEKDKLVIAKAITKKPLSLISEEKDIKDSDRFFFISDKNVSQEILDKNKFDIVGVDSTYFEHDDKFFISLDMILTADSIHGDFFIIRNLSNKSNYTSHCLAQTQSFLNKFLNRETFRKFPKNFTTQNIKYLEDKLNFELENLNNNFNNKDNEEYM